MIERQLPPAVGARAYPQATCAGTGWARASRGFEIEGNVGMVRNCGDRSARLAACETAHVFSTPPAGAAFSPSHASSSMGTPQGLEPQSPLIRLFEWRSLSDN